MSSNKGMCTKSYTQITNCHSSNTPSACGGDPLLRRFYFPSRITVLFCIAGFRPGSRATFVSAKVAKTIDAPPGLMK